MRVSIPGADRMSDFGSKPVKHMLVLSLDLPRPESQTARWKRGIILHCMNDPQPEGHMASYLERRKFLATLAGAAAAWPLAAHAQQSAMPVIGLLSGRSPDDSSHLVAVFRQGLKQAGFIEG